MAKRYFFFLCLVCMLLTGCNGATTISRQDQLGLKGAAETTAVSAAVTEKQASEGSACQDSLQTAGQSTPEETNGLESYPAFTEPEAETTTVLSPQLTTEPTVVPSTVPTPERTTAPATEPSTEFTTAPTTTPVTAPPEITEPPETTEPEKDPYDISNHEVGELEKEILALINAQRGENGLDPLTMDVKLAAIAMVRGYECSIVFSHTRPDGRDCFTALDDYEYTCEGAVGENILMCTYGMSAEAMVNVWMDSDGHRANILREEYTLAGIGAWVKGGMIYVANLFAA